MTNRSSWIFFNVVGYTVAGAAFGALQRARYQRYYEVVTSASDAVSIATLNTAKSLAVFGILLGTAQWLALWRHGSRVGGSPRPRWDGRRPVWPLASSAG
jgi:hypothetical protein